MTSPAAARAGRREWIGLAVIALPCILYSVDFTVLHLAVPAISAELKPTSSQLLWIVDIYGFMLAGFLVTMGTLGDRIGRRRLLLIGAVVFGLASVLAALSSSAEMLIVTRALLGIAAATLAPSTLSLIRNMFHDPRDRTIAISVWITSFSVGAAIGPLIGGIMLEFFWWGSVFLLAVPVMVLLLVLGPLLLPEYKDPNARRLDLLSAALSLIAVLSVIFGLKQIAEDGPGVTAVASMILGLVVGAAFVRRQATLDEPLLDLELFQRPAFSAALTINTFDFFVSFAMFLFIAQYFQLVVGLSPLTAGLWTLPTMVTFAVGSMLTPVLVRRVPPRTLIVGGLVVGAVGFALLVLANGPGGLPIVVVASVVFSLGLSPVTTLGTDIMLATAPPERAGAAAGISETSSEFGGALGIAVLGSIVTAVYRADITSAIPDGVPAAIADVARDTLGGAVDVAARLPDDVSMLLLQESRNAFVNGVHLVAIVCAVLVIALAVLARLMLPATPVTGEESPA